MSKIYTYRELLTLTLFNDLRKHMYIFILYIIPLHWNGIVSLNQSLYKTWVYLFNIFDMWYLSIMAADNQLDRRDGEAVKLQRVVTKVNKKQKNSEYYRQYCPQSGCI